VIIAWSRNKSPEFHQRLTTILVVVIVWIAE
jgi:hypothetical protein